MSSFKYNIEKFDGKNDFNLWRKNMIAHLGNLGLDEALKGELKMSSALSEKEKSEILKKARNMILLSVNDQIPPTPKSHRSTCTTQTQKSMRAPSQRESTIVRIMAWC